MAAKNEKIDINDFPLHDYTQEQNGSPYFSSIVRLCKWPSLSTKVVEIQKFCYHCNRQRFLLSIKKLNALRLWLLPSPLSPLRSRASTRAGVGRKEESEKYWEWKMDRVFSSSSLLATPAPATVRITKMTGEETALWPTETLWLPHGP